MAWLLPTHSRPKKLQRLIDSASESDREQRLEIALWKDDPFLGEYLRMRPPQAWEFRIVDDEWCGQKLNGYFKRNPNEKFYGFIADDIELAAPGMLAILAESAGDWHVAYPDDGVHGPKLATHFCCGGEFVRALGYWTHPSLRHNYIDYLLMDVAGNPDLRLLKYHPECRLVVRHPYIKHPEEFDATYKKAMVVNELADIYYQKLQHSGEIARMIQRIKEKRNGLSQS